MYQKHNIRVYKMGPKLGIYFPKKFFAKIDINKGEYIKIFIQREGETCTFLTRMNELISLRNDVIDALRLHPGDMVDILISKLANLERPKDIFHNNKIDILALIPNKTSRNYNIIIDKFLRENQEWLRVWYSHDRGSGRQIEIKRYIDIDSFGRLMGQMQAEGTKSSIKMFRFEFCNKLISEHIDFVKYLLLLGLPENLLISDCIFHPNVKNIKQIIRNFESGTGRKVKYIIENIQSKGSYGFRTYIRNTLLTEILLSAINTMRTKMVKESLDKNLRIFANAFFAKVLTGDGTLDIRTKNREYGFPYTRIKIVDRNLSYLEDYAIIMKKLGFKPKILSKYISVRAGVHFENLLQIYNIRAFENTNNWKKLLILIKIYLQGRRLKTNYRFVDLIDCKKFTSLDLSIKYKVHIRSANDWLRNKEVEGYVKRLNMYAVPIEWTLTNKARELAKIIKTWKGEFGVLGYPDSDPYDILSSLKQRVSQKAS